MDFQKIKDLYLKSLIGKATPEEEAQIEAYLVANPSLTEPLLEYAKSQIRSVSDYNSQLALQKIKKQLKPKMVSGFFTLKSVAAAILLIIGCVALYLNLTPSYGSDWKIYTSNEEIGFKNITLSDGSTIVLQNGSTLKVDAKFGDNEQRLLALDGQAFFTVKRDTTKPFIIRMPISEVKVLGTSFNINNSLNKSTIMVNSGKVQVVNIQSHNDIILVKNEGVIDDGKVMLKTSFKNNNYQAWFTGKFNFNGVKIENVINELNTFYNNKFQLSKSFSSSCLLTADFDNQPIDAIIEVLTLSCEISVKKVGSQYIVQ